MPPPKTTPAARPKGAPAQKRPAPTRAPSKPRATKKKSAALPPPSSRPPPQPAPASGTTGTPVTGEDKAVAEEEGAPAKRGRPERAGAAGSSMSTTPALLDAGVVGGSPAPDSAEAWLSTGVSKTSRKSTPAPGPTERKRGKIEDVPATPLCPVSSRTSLESLSEASSRSSTSRAARVRAPKKPKATPAARPSEAGWIASALAEENGGRLLPPLEDAQLDADETLPVLLLITDRHRRTAGHAGGISDPPASLSPRRYFTPAALRSLNHELVHNRQNLQTPWPGLQDYADLTWAETWDQHRKEFYEQPLKELLALCNTPPDLDDDLEMSRLADIEGQLDARAEPGAHSILEYMRYRVVLLVHPAL